MTDVVAALDAGTNTLRLLIAGRTGDGRLVELNRQLRFVGLGQGVSVSGRFAPEAMARAWAAIDEYRSLIVRHDAGRVRFVATSAARDAANRDEFFAGVTQRLGIRAELISGDEEARLSFGGALAGADLGGPGAVLVMDSGGGSTELVRGDASGRVYEAVSLDIGSRRLREGKLLADPPTADQIAAARAVVNRLLDTAAVGLDRVGSFIGVAGTVTSMAAVNLGLTGYDRKRVHASRMTVAQVAELADRLLAMTASEVAALGPVAPDRARVLASGALIVAEVAGRVGVDLQVSETDILDGIAHSIFEEGRGQRLG